MTPRYVCALSSWHRRVIYAVLALSAVTGVAWFVLRDLLSLAPSSQDRFVLVLHGMAGSLALVAFGSVLVTHVTIAWHMRINRVPGLLAALTIGILGLTAWGLYYASEEQYMVFKWIHIVCGMAAIAAFPLHIVLGRAGYRQSDQSDLSSHSHFVSQSTGQ